MIVNAIKQGVATIILTDAKKNESSMIQVTVVDKNTADLSISVTELDIYTKSSESVLITSGSGNYTVESSNAEVATAECIDNTILVTAHTVGTATITVTDTESGFTATIEVTVTEEATDDLTLSETSVSLQKDDRATVTITSGSGSYTLENSNEEAVSAAIANTNQIVIVGQKAGTATITVTDTKSGQTATIAVTVTDGSDVSPTEGLVAYYPFNGNANDESGCGNHGVPTENVVLDTGLNGDSNGAYRFGGYDNPGHIFVANSESLQFSEGATFSVYVKPTSWLSMDGWGYRTDKNGAQCIIAKEHDRYGITFLLAGDEQKCNVWMGSFEESWAGLGTEEKLIGNYLNKWMHLAFVYGNGYARLYVNGQLVDERESTPDFSRVNNQNMYIGKFSDYWYPFNGLIDEVRIYNRALDLDEVRTLANYKTQ